MFLADAAGLHLVNEGTESFINGDIFPQQNQFSYNHNFLADLVKYDNKDIQQLWQYAQGRIFFNNFKILGEPKQFKKNAIVP